MNYKELKEYLESKNINLKDVLAQINYSRQGFSMALDNETIDLKRLKALCKAAKISPSYFFDAGTFAADPFATDSDKVLIESLKQEVSFLKKRLEDKEEIIRILKDGANYQSSSPSSIAATPIEKYGSEK